MTKPPTLTDPKGMGGITAQSGYDYQLWDALARLPEWLRGSAFEGLILEGLEDYEARFFSPYAPRTYFLDRFQAKSGALTAGDLTGVFTSFRDFDLAHSHVARIQTLVTPALPPRLAWVGTNAVRLRRASGFYRPFADVLAASTDKVIADLAAEFGHDLAPFIAKRTEVSLRSWTSREAAEAEFTASLHNAFPSLDVSHRKCSTAFSSLSELVSTSRGTLVTRRRLLEVLEKTLGLSICSNDVLHLRVHSDDGDDDRQDVAVDAVAFSGRDGRFPEPSLWQVELTEPLLRLAHWARDRRYQRIAIDGHYRLSTSLLLGWALRSAAGFELDIPTKAGPWPTDTHATPGDAPPWQLSLPKSLLNGRLTVGVGVLRSPEPAMLRTLPHATTDNLLLATLGQALTSAREVQASARAVKHAVDAAIAQLQPTAIDLFYSGPAALGVALGHRWNGLPPTQLWEFLSNKGVYTPTAVLDAAIASRLEPG